MRNYIGRVRVPSNTTVDNFYTHKLLGQDNKFPVCKPDTQFEAKYDKDYPMASVKAGETITVMYTPNGHSDPGDVGRTTYVRIHWNRKANGPGPTLKVRGDLNQTNELTRWLYGDKCANGGDVASLPCPNDLTIPLDTPSGTYQMVYYWPYNKVATQNPFGEEYYSCFDVKVEGLPRPSTDATANDLNGAGLFQPLLSLVFALIVLFA
eukprot:TRINITY_DN49_c0_g1_i2.p1 TRINITY_DN49_c0_g1~~TRINITY_DN49_c0_g1_i2.p1  ORF type:complete len:236 (-),score=50.18 TRINITY_DN49_c0_g1_i2:23-646(-)